MFSLKVLVDYVVVQQVLNNSWLKQGSESPISSYVSRMILQRTSPLVYLGPWLNELSNFILIPICFFIVLTLFSLLNHAHLLNALQLLSQVCSLEETLYSGTCMVGLFRDYRGCACQILTIHFNGPISKFADFSPACLTVPLKPHPQHISAFRFWFHRLHVCIIYQVWKVLSYSLLKECFFIPIISPRNSSYILHLLCLFTFISIFII